MLETGSALYSNVLLLPGVLVSYQSPVTYQDFQFVLRGNLVKGAVVECPFHVLGDAVQGEQMLLLHPLPGNPAVKGRVFTLV